MDAVLEFGYEATYDFVDTYIDAATLDLYDKGTLVAEIYDKWDSANSATDSYNRVWAWAFETQAST